MKLRSSCLQSETDAAATGTALAAGAATAVDTNLAALLAAPDHKVLNLKIRPPLPRKWAPPPNFQPAKGAGIFGATLAENLKSPDFWLGCADSMDSEK